MQTKSGTRLELGPDVGMSPQRVPQNMPESLETMHSERYEKRLRIAKLKRIWTASAASVFILAPTFGWAEKFQDWEIGCDNTRACIAIGMSANPDFAGEYARLDRSGTADAQADFVIWLPAVWKSPGDLTLTVDGESIPGLSGLLKPTAPDPDSELRSIRLDPQWLFALIERLRGTKKLALRSEKEEAVAISLAGMRDVLAKLDEVQGRAGTVSALVSKGGKLSSTIPTAPPMPVITVLHPPVGATADSSLLMLMRRKVQQDTSLSCVSPEAIPPVPLELAGSVAPLAGGRTLVQVNCENGPYNSPAVYMIVTGNDAEHARQAEFLIVDTTTGRLRPSFENRVVNGEYSQQTGIISFFSKGRGYGDCGVYGSYGWTGSGFSLLSQHQIESCKGVDSDGWPVYWRAQIRKRQ